MASLRFASILSSNYYKSLENSLAGEFLMRDNFNVMHRPDGHARVLLPSPPAASSPSLSSPLFSPFFSPFPPPIPFLTSPPAYVRPGFMGSAPVSHPSPGSSSRWRSLGWSGALCVCVCVCVCPQPGSSAGVPLAGSPAVAGNCYLALILYIYIFFFPHLLRSG